MVDYGTSLRGIYRLCDYIWQALVSLTDTIIDVLFYELPAFGFPGRTVPLILYVFSTALSVFLVGGIVRAIIKG